MLTAEQILSMPLTELQERVQLAERLALAARLTPESGHYAAAVPSVQPTPAAPAADAPRRGRPPKATTPTTPAAAPAAAPAQAPALASDDLSLDMDDGGTEAADGAELSLDDDDMDMLGLDTPSVTPEQMRSEIVAIATKIKNDQDKNRLTAVRGLMQKYGVNRVSEVSDANLAAFYNEMKAV